MKSTLLLLGLSLALLTGCGGDAGTGAVTTAPILGIRHGADPVIPVGEALTPAARRELAAARRATAKFHSPEAARAAGYEDIHVFASGQGEHYLKSDLMDAAFDPERPELLVYANAANGSGLELVAVEYAVPTALSATAPEGFDGAADVWSVNPTFPLWTLHVWLWKENPSGLFAETHPDLP